MNTTHLRKEPATHERVVLRVAPFYGASSSAVRPHTGLREQGLQTTPRPVMAPRGHHRPAAGARGAGKGKFGFLVDAVGCGGARLQPPRRKGEVKKVKRLRACGWADYPDCQRHFLAWPRRPRAAVGVQRPQYGAWCGNAKYAPAYSKARRYPRLN